MKNLTLKEKIKACWYILNNQTNVAQILVKNNEYIQGYKVIMMVCKVKNQLSLTQSNKL